MATAEIACLDQTKMCDDQDLKSLQEGKTNHFFVSYESDDKERVSAIVNELENKFGLKCVFHERDFQAGKYTCENIHEGMIKSEKVLLFLTPNFLASAWCKYELNNALVTSMGCGYSCIVPVLLDECEIPFILKTFTYIDGTIPGIDVPAKIANSLLDQETDEGLFLLGVQTLNKKYENGYCYPFLAKREKVCAYRPAKYRFTVDSNLFETLRENRVEVPEMLLQSAVDILNKDSVMWSYDYLNRCQNFMWCLLLVPFYFLIYILGYYGDILSTSSRFRKDVVNYYTDLFSVLMAIVVPVSFVFIQIAVCFIPEVCHRKKREVSLQTKLWQKVGKQCMEQNILLLFTGRRSKTPTLYVMRYNIARCKEHYVGTLKSKNILSPDQVETDADMKIERYLSENFSTLADDFDFLPDAPYNRHNVKKGKMCICQQLEHDLLRGH